MIFDPRGSTSTGKATAVALAAQGMGYGHPWHADEESRSVPSHPETKGRWRDHMRHWTSRTQGADLR